jgi:predicted transcriptional regulator of viral defense system
MTPRKGPSEKLLTLAKLPRPAGNFVTLSSLAQLLELPLPSARIAAGRLEKKGVLWRVGPGLYANRLADPSIEQLAGILWSPSYLSLEWALAFHGISQQKTSEATCVTLHRPRRVQTPLGTLSFVHVAKSLFFGFKKEPVLPGVESWVAEPEKALLDWIYLRRRAGEPIALDEFRLSLLRPTILKQYSQPFPASVKTHLELR